MKYNEEDLRREYLIQASPVYGMVRAFKKAFNGELSIIAHLYHTDPGILGFYAIYQGAATAMVLAFPLAFAIKGIEALLS